ncbi:MAG: TlpA family protein disulfide reductase [Ignavibacteriaceae bacterium]
MLKHLFILLFILTVVSAFAQPVSIIVKNSSETTAYLFSLRGEEADPVDSVKSTEPGVFSFDGTKLHRGFYKLSAGKNKFIDFVFDKEEVTLTTEASHIADSMVVLKSESNRLYYEFLRLTKEYKTKTELLRLVISRYPPNDDYYQQTKKHLDRIQEDYLYFANVTAQKNEDLFIAKYIRSAHLPVIPLDLQPNKELEYLKAHALDNINFYTTELIYSDLFSARSIEFLTYYRNPQLPLELLEKEFNKAIDSILNRAKVNESVYTHIVEYLIGGFKKFGFENVLNYIVNNYVIKDGLCLNEKDGSSTQRMINQNKFLPIGALAPHVTLPDGEAKTQDISKIGSGKILLVFYASWCPHCKTVLPEINNLVPELKKKNISPVAISLDTDKDAWNKFAKENCANLINLSDLKGWDGKAAADYFIYATPTMFLLDRENKIIAKPKSVEDLRRFLTD